MTLNDFIDANEQLISTHQNVTEVVKIGGKLTKEDIEQMRFSNRGATVLLCSPGGQMSPGLAGRVDLDAMVFVYVFAHTDTDSAYRSSEANQTAIELVQLIAQNSIGKANRDIRTTPEFVELMELETIDTYSCWSIVYKQKITL